MRALSIRHPHAEAILRGAKKIEYRKRPTKIREVLYIYAALGRYTVDEEAEWVRRYAIKDVTGDDLLRDLPPEFAPVFTLQR